MNQTRKGTIEALAAYLIWGLLPIFWKTLKAVPPYEILGHRIIWSFLILVSVLTVKRHWHWVKSAYRQPRIVVIYVGTSLLIGLNWLSYIWAVNSGFLVEASLGYFINPLISVLLGVFFLKEKLRRGQWIALCIASGGVFYLTFGYGTFPWIALWLAFSFGFYGLLRKTGPLTALEGLSFETGALTIPAIGILLFIGQAKTATFGQTGILTNILLVCTGIATALPMFLFASAARKIPLSTIGILQYIAPTLQFLLGVIVYGEIFSQSRFIGFLFIWIALAVYTTESIIQRKKIRNSY